MPHGKIGEDEVTGLRRAVQVSHSSHGHTGQYWASRIRGKTALGHGTSGFQSGVQEEIGVVCEGDVGLVEVVVGIGLVHSKFDDRWRIDWTTVRRGYIKSEPSV